MGIENRIDELKEIGYFKEMQVTMVDNLNVIYVIMQFPKKWIVDKDEIASKYNVTVQNGNTIGEFYFCSEMSNGFDKVFDSIEFSINMMKEAEERADLLKTFTIKLKELFEDESIPIEKLRTLEFSFRQEEKSKKGKERNISEINFDIKENKTTDNNETKE